MMEYYFDLPTVFSVSLNEGNSGFPNLVDHCLESFHKKRPSASYCSFVFFSYVLGFSVSGMGFTRFLPLTVELWREDADAGGIAAGVCERDTVTLENVGRYMLPRQINEPGGQGF
jgi:hypothetical protein